ncbi:MAG: dihydroorotate dehydrogenase [Actinomycetota bacterium]|nr:dihydroorotate dehydrogenase [Actinomycetota bacterium]
MKRLGTSLGTYVLSSPLIAAAGTVGSIVEFADVIDFSLYGAATTKSVAPEPWPGREPPRIAPGEMGMLNSIGIQNTGIDVWAESMATELAGIPTKVWGSVVAHDIEGFGEVARRMADVGVSAIEVNLSCPNLDGTPFALDPLLSRDVVRCVRDAVSLPIGAKLSSDAEPITAVASAVQGAGADWVVVANTVMAARIDPVTRRPVLSGLIGGYSGAPIRPITLRSVLQVARDLPDLPIVGCGGVSQAGHVVEYLLAGAAAVAIGSAHFKTPRVARKITRDLERYIRRHELSGVAELIGAYEPW